MMDNYEKALYTIEELQKQINELKESLREPVKKKTPFDFDDREMYHTSNLKNVEKGKLFKTRTLADRQDDKDRLIKDLWEWWYLNDGVKLDWVDDHQNKYAIVYDNDVDNWIVYYWMSTQVYFDRPYYSSEKLAEQVLEEFKDRLDILLLPIYEES